MDGSQQISSTEVKLRWFEPFEEEGLTNYILYKDEGSGFVLYDDTISIGTNEYIDTITVDPDTDVSYYIVSYDGSNESIPSNIVTIHIAASFVPAATITNIDAIDLHTARVDFNPPQNESAIIDYAFYANNQLKTIETVGGNTTYIFDLLSGVNYNIHMISRGFDAQSGNSNTVSVTLSNQTIGDFADPPEISDLVSDNNGTTHLLITEPDNTTGIIEYQVQHRIEDETGFVNVDSLPVGNILFIENVTLNKVVSYRISSLTQDGLGYPSNVYSIASSVDLYQLNSTGHTLEPTLQNTLSTQQINTITQTLEFFDVQQSSIQNILTDLNNDVALYEVITKMQTGEYDTTTPMAKVAGIYAENYIHSNNITQFVEELELKIRIATGDDLGIGDAEEIAEDQDGT